MSKGSPEFPYDTRPTVVNRNPTPQSDAPPSAETFEDFYERTEGTPVEDIGVFSHQHIIKVAEAYAALRTAQRDEQVKVIEHNFIREAGERAQAQVKVAQLERERDELLSWKKNVSTAVKNIPEFHLSGAWGGDREGCGFHFEMVNYAQRQRVAAEAQLATLREETLEQCAKIADRHGWHDVGDEIRSLAQPQKVTKEKK